ncbi:hypothetical protein ABPG77_003516 [Micractinium sp. CCAP 211/92]
MGRIGGRPAVDYRRLAAGDVSDLSLGVDALGTDFRVLHAELLNYGGYRPANLRRVAPAQLTPDWLQQSGGFRPVLVPAAPGAARDMGLALPEGSLTVDRLASKVGLPFEVHTTDVQTQGEGPRWTLHQWSQYWDARRSASRDPAAHAPGAGGGAATNGGAGDASAQAAATPRRAAPAEDEADSAAVRRKRSAEEEAAAQQLKGISAESKKRLLEVAALPLAGTPLEGEVSPPSAVRGVDLAQQVWPQGAPSRPTAGVTLVMSPEGAYTDFHMAAGGASVWLHCISGRRNLALVPPTPRNLATYAAWAASARYAGVFLPAHCEGAMRVELGPGACAVMASLPCEEVRERLAQQLSAMAAEDAAAAAAAGRSQGEADSDSVSKAGAAKKRKGWPTGQDRELADDAGTQHVQQAGAAAAANGAANAAALGAAQRTQQPPRAVLGRAGAGSPMAAAGPRQIGRAVGGGSRLRKAGGAGGGGAAARGPVRRMIATSLTIDVRGGGGGGGGGGGRAQAGGGGFPQRKRQRSPDSFIEQDSDAEAASNGGKQDGDAGGADWAPLLP